MIVLATCALEAGRTHITAVGPLVLTAPVTVALQGRGPGEEWVTLAAADLAPQTRAPHVVLQYTLGRHGGAASVTTAGSEARLVASAPLDGLTLEVA